MFFAGMLDVGFLNKMRSVAILALAMGVSACAGAGPGSPMDPDCVGTKCDEPLGPPTPHAIAVANCDEGHQGDMAESTDSTTALAAWNEYHACLSSANNSTISTIENNLADAKLPRDREAIVETFDEFRYASLCTDIESIAKVFDDELALVATQCATTRERSLSHALSALVDYSGERSTVFLGDARESFADCYSAYDALSPEEFPSQGYFADRQALVECAGDNLRSEALLVRDVFCEIVGCPDELLITSFILAGFETAIDTSSNVCGMLVDASIYEGADAMQQDQSCRLAIYGQLRVATLDGLSE